MGILAPPTGHRSSGFFQHPWGVLSGTPRAFRKQYARTREAGPSGVSVPKGRHDIGVRITDKGHQHDEGTSFTPSKAKGSCQHDDRHPQSYMRPIASSANIGSLAAWT